MARMIPPYISENCRSPGERLLFAKFRDDPETCNWTVLHSLGIAKHPERQSGELDFVVIAPGKGVLCLEIKAGNVSRTNGVWKYGESGKTITSLIGPFRQASDAMHGLRQKLVQRDQSIAKVLFCSAVVFTLIDFDEESPEWHSWQVVGRSQLTSYPLSRICDRVFERAHDHTRSVPSSHWYNGRDSRPTADQAHLIANFLRPDFEYQISLKSVHLQTESIIGRYTTEQFAALDLLDENHRALFKGPAGTGKTFLALEAARRYALRGYRTLFVCFNSLLSKWLKEQVEAWPAEIRALISCGSWHQQLTLITRQRTPDDAPPEYWSRDLPNLLIDRILSSENLIPQFQAIVVDEAQDLVKEPYLDAMELLLEGGLAGGHWAMFGDFELQAIYRDAGDTPADMLDCLSRRAPSFVRFPLRVNCRNTARIATAIEIATNLTPGYSRVLTDANGFDVEVAFYSDAKSELTILRHWCNALLQRYEPEDVVILSMRADQSSTAARLAASEPGFSLSPKRELNDGAIGYASIHSFKGLEARAVILTDVERIDSLAAQALLYVGMSRARLSLVLLMHERCAKTWNAMLLKGLDPAQKHGGSVCEHA